MRTRRTAFATLAVVALSAAAWTAGSVPAQAGGDPAGRTIRFESTQMGGELKVKARGVVVNKDGGEKVRLEVESGVLSAGAQLQVQFCVPGSSERPELAGVVDLVKDARDPSVARGTLEWTVKPGAPAREIHISNCCDARFVYLVGK